MSDTACDVSACTSHERCDIWHEWCKVWRYAHNHSHSSENAACLRERIPGRFLSADKRGRIHVAPEAFNA
jgi:hypothetical protein